MEQILANHSYVDISQVGTGSAAVQCHTDLSMCCAAAKGGTHHGDWYFPNRDKLPIAGSTDRYNIIEVHKDHGVELLHSSDTTKPTGICHCDFPKTDSVHKSGMRETVHVGLYTSDGGKVYLQCESENDVSFMTQAC